MFYITLSIHYLLAPRSNERYCGKNVILLQLAVEHGMGGAESAAKATWMVDAIDQWFQENGYFLTVTLDNSTT